VAITDRYHRLHAEVFPWFSEPWQRLVSLKTQDRLPHAILLNGMKGIGKGDLAAALAGLVLCHNPQAQHRCGHCRSCELFDSSGHPDLYHLKPEAEGKQIKVDQVRELANFMHSTAQQGGYRVVVLEPAEEMNIAAANALLKTLEEPGRDSLLILITHQLGQVMATIKSRCQRLDCHRPQPEQAVPWLAEKLEVDGGHAAKLLQLVHGAPLAALNFSSSGAKELRGEFLSELKSVLQRRTSALDAAAKLSKGDALEAQLGWLYTLLADVARLKACGEGCEIKNADMAKMLTALAKRTSAEQLYQLADLVQGERSALLQHQNPNKQLLLERLLLAWSKLLS